MHYYLTLSCIELLEREREREREREEILFIQTKIMELFDTN